jgi:hypothetical protein
MPRKLLQDEQPNYIAAIFESGEKTFGMKPSVIKLTGNRCPTIVFTAALHQASLRSLQRSHDQRSRFELTT